MKQAVGEFRRVHVESTNVAPVGGCWPAAGKEQNWTVEDGRTTAPGCVAVARGERAEKVERTEKQEADWVSLFCVMGQDAARVVTSPSACCLCELRMTRARALNIRVQSVGLHHPWEIQRTAAKSLLQASVSDGHGVRC